MTDARYGALDPTRLAPRSRALGAATIVLAIGFNLPYAGLAASFDYPQVLRRPAHDALAMFLAAGPQLILLWYGFFACALALTLLAPGLAVTPARLAARPALALGAALTGALAGLAQAIGLSRWVFAVPDLARDGSPAAARAFQLLNAWGGVAIGEHVGQLLTAAFVLQVALMQRTEAGSRLTAVTGLCTAGLLALGAGEGVALALGRDGATLALVTVAGFMGLTLWLIATGVGLLRAGPART